EPARSRPQFLHAGYLSSIAYVMFTSGSVGRPKAVAVTHSGLASLARAQAARFMVSGQSRVLQYASLNFDASVSELLTALTTGAALVMVSEDARAGIFLREHLERHRITHATL